MVNQLKKDLPESQKSPFPLQTVIIPYIFTIFILFEFVYK